MGSDEIREILGRHAAAWKANGRAGGLAPFVDDATVRTDGKRS